MRDDAPTIRLVSGADIAVCQAIRRTVFVEEQGIAEADDLDGQDDACQHILVRRGPAPIGAARLAFSPGRMKVQRVCVLPESRGQGIGEDIMRFAVAQAQEQGCQEVVLGAQLAARAFYERLGFRPEGDIFDDAGAPHQMMRLAL